MPPFGTEYIIADSFGKSTLFFGIRGNISDKFRAAVCDYEEKDQKKTRACGGHARGWFSLARVGCIVRGTDFAAGRERRTQVPAWRRW